MRTRPRSAICGFRFSIDRPDAAAALTAAFLVSVCLFWPGAASARVFQLGGASGDLLLDRHPDWKSAYTTTVRLNGGGGELRVVGAAGPLPIIFDQALKAYEAEGWKTAAFCGASLGWGVAVKGGEVTRLLSLKLPDRRETLLLRVRQSLEDYRRSGRPPEQAQTADVPVPPGGVSTFFAADEGAATGLEMLALPASPEEARGFYAARLAEAGWQAVAAADAVAPAGIYMKGSIVLLCVVKSAGAGRGSLVTVLRKNVGPRALGALSPNRGGKP